MIYDDKISTNRIFLKIAFFETCFYFLSNLEGTLNCRVSAMGEYVNDAL